MEKKELQDEQFVVEPNDAIDEFVIFRKPDTIKVNAQDLRIEETVTRTWSGVSSCGDANVKAKQIKDAYEGWVAKKLFEYRHLRYKTYGHGEGTIRVSHSRAPWPDNSRSCRGSLSLPCYIVFEQG